MHEREQELSVEIHLSVSCTPETGGVQCLR